MTRNKYYYERNPRMPKPGETLAAAVVLMGMGLLTVSQGDSWTEGLLGCFTCILAVCTLSLLFKDEGDSNG